MKPKYIYFDAEEEGLYTRSYDSRPYPMRSCSTVDEAKEKLREMADDREERLAKHRWRVLHELEKHTQKEKERIAELREYAEGDLPVEGLPGQPPNLHQQISALSFTIDHRKPVCREGLEVLEEVREAFIEAYESSSQVDSADDPMALYRQLQWVERALRDIQKTCLSDEPLKAVHDTLLENMKRFSEEPTDDRT